MSKSHRRRQVLVDRRLQLRLIGWLTLITLCALVFQAGLFLSALADVATLASSDPQIAFEQALRSGTRMLFVSVAAVLPLMVIVGTLTTFRIAGPLYRIQQFLEDVVAGKAPADCALRKDDELTRLRDLVNAATAEQRQRDAARNERATESESGSEPETRAA